MAVSELKEGAVNGFLHQPEQTNGTAFVLAHGAGSDANAPVLVKLAEALAETQCGVLRLTLPFRLEKRPPLPANAHRDRAALGAAVALLKRDYAHVILGGHSYGGRQATMLAAEDAGVAGHLLALSYPLHPPDKPQQLRTDHFPKLRVPILFVHGTRDPFGTVDEMERAVKLIPAKCTVVPIEKAGHDLRAGRFKFVDAVVDYFARSEYMH